MTYLNLVNNILRRMREDEVGTVSATPYSKMVGDYVNDAKRQVEEAWDWSGLRNSFTVSLDAGVNEATLADSLYNVKVYHAYNNTNDTMLEYRPSQWFDEKYDLGEVTSGAPQYYTFVGLDANDDSKIKVYPSPDKTYSLEFKTNTKKDPLTGDSDRLYVPEFPVMQMALAFLVRERGETGGQSAAEYFLAADRALSDAIARDAQKHPEDLIWYY